MIYTPYGLIWVSGRQISSAVLEDLLEIKIDLREKKASTGHIILKDEYASYFDSKVFRKGAWLAFLMGWAHEFDMFGPYVIKGYKMDFPEDGFPKLTINFQDISIRMHKKEKRKKHIGKPKNILKKIASEYGLGYDIDSMGDLEFSDEKPLIQANQTDAAFLQRLAHRYGYVWGIDGVNLYFRRPMDFDEINRQYSIPRLSWAEKTLKSYTFEIKTAGGKKKKDSTKNTTNIDLDGDGNPDEVDNETLAAYNAAREEIKTLYGTDSVDAQTALEDAQKKYGKLGGFETNMARDLVGLVGDSKLSKLLAVGEEEEGGDEEVKPDKDPEKPSKTEDETHWRPNVERGTWYSNQPVFDWTDPKWVDDIVEGKSDTPGAAAPENEDEAKNRVAGDLIRSSEIIEGSFIPPISSVWYKPGKTVYLDLPSNRLTGKYHIDEVNMVWNIDGFNQKITKAHKRTFMPKTSDKDKTDDAPIPGSEEGNKEKLPEDTYGWVPDAVSGRFNYSRIIDGEEDSETLVSTKKSAPNMWSKDALNQQSGYPVDYIYIKKSK